MLAEDFVEEDIVAGWSTQHHAHAHAIGTETFDEVEGIGAVAERLGHLTTELVAHNTCEIDVLERHLAFILVARHNHAGHPEEDDVGTCHKVGSGIVVLNLLVAGIADAIEEADGPEPAGEPGVQRVLVLTEIRELQVGIATLFTSELQSLLLVFSNNETARGQIPRGDAMAPPELTANAPVFDVLEPVAVGILILCGIELDVVVHHGRQRDVGHVLHLQEPLHGELGLDGHARALGATNLVVIILNLLHEAGGDHVLGNLLAAGETFGADIAL